MPGPSSSPLSRRTRALGAIALVSTLVGATVALAIFPHAWGVDADRNLSAARDLVAGRFGADHGYVYSPLAAALTVPWTSLPTQPAIALWFLARATLLTVGIAIATRGWPPIDRLLAAVVTVTFVPVLYDLLLGNVSIVLAAVLAVVAWRSDRWWTGVWLGLAIATIPKPQLVPVLAWMLFYRPRSLAGAAITAGIATLIAILVLGIGPYEAWIAVLRSVDYVSGPMYGNLSLFVIVPPPFGAALAVLAVGVTALAMARGSLQGLTACLALGMLVSPYTLAYAPVLLLVVSRAAVDQRPRETAVLALTGSFGVVVALPLWLIGVIATALGLRADPAERSSASATS